MRMAPKPFPSTRPAGTEIDVVITDMVMPIMDGPATIIALRSINPEVKIVSSSGMASEGGVAKARNAGDQTFHSQTLHSRNHAQYAARSSQLEALSLERHRAATDGMTLKP